MARRRCVYVSFHLNARENEQAELFYGIKWLAMLSKKLRRDWLVRVCVASSTIAVLESEIYLKNKWSHHKRRYHGPFALCSPPVKNMWFGS